MPRVTQTPPFNPNASNGGMFDPTQDARIRQQRELADRLQQIGASTPTEYTPGKYSHAVPKSPLENISKGFATGLSSYQTAQSNSAEQEMERKRQELLAEALQRMGQNDPQGAYETLANDPALIGQVLDMKRQDMLNEAKEARSDFEFEREADLKRELKQMGGGGGVTIDPETGALIYNKPLNATQGKANLFASRMAESDKIIQNVGNTGTQYDQRMLSKLPLGVGNMLVSPEYQQLDQAERDFVNATLRQESGAVINPDEFDNARKQYFPQPGDSPQVIEQKARNRALAIAKMQEMTGRPQMPDAGGDDFDAQYEAMPSGTVFVDPNGVTRRKP